MEDFAAVYERHFNDVCRWLRAMGAPDGDLEDLAQDVFMVAQRKYQQFDGKNSAGWLYQIAWRVSGDARRRSWFKHLFSRRGAARVGELDGLADTGAGPAELLERREARQLLHRLLSHMTAKRRAVFVLSEIEGYTGEQIATLEGLKVATVWTRLHHARRDFLHLVEQLRKQEMRDGRGLIGAGDPAGAHGRTHQSKAGNG